MSSSTHPRPSSVHSQPVLPSGYVSSSSSTGHGHIRPTSRGRPSSYYSVDTVNLAEAFADVNRALGSRPARQPVALGKSSSQAGPSRALKTPSPEPLRAPRLKKPQPANDTPAHMDVSRGAEARRWEGANPRFSIASEPAYTRPLVAPWEPLRMQDSSRRASFVEQSMAPRRPDLKIVIPGAPAGQRAHHGERDAAGKGQRPASKSRSGCVIM